jgi:erythromycin esterase-like protein/predicted phosphoribosyltransferase
MTPHRFRDRHEAGRVLATKLAEAGLPPDALVLALPRGGVPVGYEIARALRAPLDVFVVRKLGIPGHEELAMGALASGGVRVLDERVIQALGIPDSVIEAVTAREQRELARRERVYRGDRPPPDVRGRTVILVDDGLATGSTMLAAVRALKRLQPARIVVAVPTAAAETCQMLRSEADDVICAATPEPFLAVGHWYEDFSQTTDDEVRALLAAAQQALDPAQGDSPTDAAPPQQLHGAMHPLTGSAQDYDPLLDLIGDARLVLLGEASHGTHEFYRERAEITKRLIREKGFVAVTAEADWPDAYRVNCYVRGQGPDVDALEALADFRRFPTWMWRNTDVVEFVEWLRAHNDRLAPDGAKAGFYGLDLYSLHASIKVVLRYLEKLDPDAAQRARERYACFDQVGADMQLYGLFAGSGIIKSCEEEVVAQLVELQRRAVEHAQRSGGLSEDDRFYLEQNARLVKNAEAYYRAAFREDVSSWNLRDRHMAETLEALIAHLGQESEPAKIVVWAHNSHLGDARATDMSKRGELNLGQLVREHYGSGARLVGFTTHHGTVTAASSWDGAAERKRVRPGLPGSYEALLHAQQAGRFMLPLSAGAAATETLREARLERAIGVIYRPETERASHYFRARLADQFDAVLHFDETCALTPLERTAEWETGELPETFPFGV